MKNVKMKYFISVSLIILIFCGLSGCVNNKPISDEMNKDFFTAVCKLADSEENIKIDSIICYYHEDSEDMFFDIKYSYCSKLKEEWVNLEKIYYYNTETILVHYPKNQSDSFSSYHQEYLEAKEKFTKYEYTSSEINQFIEDYFERIRK